jgi:putative oxidoreductase
MEIAFLIGRIIVGVYYLLGASNHLLQATTLTNYAASKGVPAPKAAVLVAGVLLLVGGLSILTGVQPGIGVLALVLFFVPVTLIMHNFWAVQDETEKMNEMIHFLKNIGLLGSALMFLGIPQPWPFSLG